MQAIFSNLIMEKRKKNNPLKRRKLKKSSNQRAKKGKSDYSSLLNLLILVNVMIALINFHLFTYEPFLRHIDIEFR